VNEQDIDVLVAKAIEHSEAYSRVGDPSMRKVVQTVRMDSYLQGLKDGIEYAKRAMHETLTEVQS
jgi:hypothetical protein